MASSHTAAVLSSLAELCVPGFSDQCQIVITQAGSSDEIRRPSLGSEALVPSILDRRPGRPPKTQSVLIDSVATPFACTDIRDWPDFHGIVVHRWVNGHQPGPVEAGLAQLGVDRAVATVVRKRLVELNSSLAIRLRSGRHRSGR
ncbi:MAG: hypothetical protein JWM76_2159 [Pseudonocardiales bacterium]|nr:hypothetical protein [Pseudonocardiales bacterium]